MRCYLVGFPLTFWRYKLNTFLKSGRAEVNVRVQCFEALCSNRGVFLKHPHFLPLRHLLIDNAKVAF